MKKILLTAFDPFNNELTNSSLEVLKQITKNITKLKLPTIYDKAYQKITNINNYDFIILLGQAGSRTKISLERFAQNLDDSSTKDNNNNLRVNKKIVNNNNLIHQTNFDIEKLYNILFNKNIPIEISNYAGNFVCNNTYYQVLDFIYQNNLQTKALFIHLPYLKNLDLNLIIDGINTIIDYLNM